MSMVVVGVGCKLTRVLPVVGVVCCCCLAGAAVKNRIFSKLDQTRNERKHFWVRAFVFVLVHDD